MPPRLPLPLAPALALGGLYLLQDFPHHLFHEPPLPLAGLALGLVGLLGLSRWGVPLAAWLWWGWGLLTALWSLAPGHTLVASLWEVWALAALGAGRWRAGVLVLLGLLLLEGVYTALALWQAGLVSYVSGSHHYLLGALALGALPLLGAHAAREGSYRVAAFLLAALALYAALISGARAVYLPLLILLPLALLRLAQEGGWARALGLALGLAGGVALLEAFVPGNAILNALAFKATLTQGEALGGEAKAGDAPSIGNVEARLLMWRLALRMAWDHPLGTGNGSYSQVFEAYMDYPGLSGVWSRSPHNYLLETLATGGWVRALLLLLLLWPTLPALRGKDWPWALSVLGLWTPMLFDVSGYYPGYLALAFLPLGALAPAPATRPVGLLGTLAAAALTLFWYWPCQGPACAARHLYFPAHTAKAVEAAAPAQRAQLLREAERHYPLSPWPLTLALGHTQGQEARLDLARKLAERFPYARESFYLLWAQAALEAGHLEEAQRALELGLRHFPGSPSLMALRASLPALGH